METACLDLLYFFDVTHQIKKVTGYSVFLLFYFTVLNAVFVTFLCVWMRKYFKISAILISSFASVQAQTPPSLEGRDMSYLRAL